MSRHARILTLLGLMVASMVGLGGKGALASELVADISSHLVAITAGFSGADLLMFGTTEGKGDVVIVVRGPDQTELVRRKDRVAGIWLNRDQVRFDNVPAFYAIASNRPLDEFVPESVRALHQIGIDHLRFTTAPDLDPGEVATFREALVRNRRRTGQFVSAPSSIKFLGPRLFRSDMRVPANAPIGTYQVQIFLLLDGEVISATITPLIVSKIGFEANVFDFAHRHAFYYGLIAIVIASVAGWGAAMVFRKV